jgi:hypothetical protein
LPLGTANDFAGTLRLPTDLERACETGAQGEVVDVDFGLSGENYYANVASVGLGAEVNQSLYSPECVEVEFSEVRAYGRAIYDVLGVAISIVGEERSSGVNETYLEAGRRGKNT